MTFVFAYYSLFILCSAFYDIGLVADEIQLSAHRAVLAARSSYFEAMFRNSSLDLSHVNATIGDIVPTKAVSMSILASPGAVG